MRVLLVEDDENKGIQLSKFVAENFPDAGVVLVKSLQSGVRYIRKNDADLILLDMTLPNYDAGPDEPGGGTTHSFGGREFLKQMDRFDVIIPVIIVTQFETFGKSPQEMDLAELDAQLHADHFPIYRGSVYYHASIHGWREALKKLVGEASKSQMFKGE